MRVHLVAMPWQAMDMPSLQVGLVRGLLGRARPDDDVSEYHGSIHWAEHLLHRTDGLLRPADYVTVGSESIFDGLGDWVFSGALYDDPDWGVQRLKEYAAKHGIAIDTALAMRPYAAEFIALAADEILAAGPDLVGLTTTFMQNVPSLALARELKRRRPELVIVFGGSNCDGPMGHALHRNHRFVDHVVRGEAERAFPALLTHLDQGTAPVDVPGLCWWDGDRSRANEETKQIVPPAEIPMPNYDAWQAVMDASPLAEFLEPKLVVEGARGCWWGEKHHCTFCGLNGSFMTFRAKSGQQLWAEIEHLVRRHRILDVITVDNIIDMAYFKDFLPLAAASDWDLRMHYEVKSNLSSDQIALLARARVAHVQPGIESLNSRVLDLMDKGVSGARNVRTLRDCETHGLTCTWNYLYGFPGESAADYLPVIDQMPALVHLQPPGDATRIALERFSPNFTDPRMGFTERRPAEMYQHVYQLPEEELTDLVYLFDTTFTGIDAEVEQQLLQALDVWKAHHHVSRLLVEEEPDADNVLLVHDRRHGWPRRTHRLAGWEADALRHLDHGRTVPALHRLLAENGHELSASEVEQWVLRCRDRGLLFQDDRTYLALPTWGAPIRITSDGTAQAEPEAMAAGALTGQAVGR
ncbi:RiPP maturation radical SAM C-methyltransferase [Streptomyces sp. XD-27]|uniref:RiPP maturation radical SAM C-methyltransferase n=1 Tax=Streptomyces sp. XD-27 TaxID=3062779 RepID=UPI0026F4260E|nr:RiPP maturation radical SAM C-methyltransferase [Streptomyces sp. XD-27]WKX73915.1 RiPP maturation radical SAM C-methyltransferase [Streptomyces sp. XD-27]